MIAPWKKKYHQPRQHIKEQRDYFSDKGPSSQSYGFSPDKGPSSQSYGFSPDKGPSSQSYGFSSSYMRVGL